MKNNTKGLLFNKVQVQTYGSNTFDLTHDVKLSGKMGNLIPVLALECIPGDSINISQESLVRFAPLISPVMHRMDVSIHNFFVPNRILWPEDGANVGWENFIVGNGGAPPTINLTGGVTAEGNKFLDYMGVPPFVAPAVTSTEISALPFAAYQRIYNEFFRDQNLIPEVFSTLTDGLQTNVVRDSLLVMRQRAWEHDYFTSALPSAAFGADVDIPLGDVILKQPHNEGIWREALGAPTTAGDVLVNAGGNTTNSIAGNPNISYDPNGSLEVAATTIKDLRRTFKVQEWLELLGRSGKRYVEFLKAFFNVDSKDKRMQRPEYINGSKTPVVISEVLNTTGETGGLPQGNMSGHAISVGNGGNGNYYVEEHGWIITILSIIPRSAYMQGIPRSFLKTDNYDYYFNQFAHIGEQEIQLKELYAYTAAGNSTFGYIPRYAEYKYMPNRVAGDFRTTLLHWTMGRKFGTAPGLSQDFIEIDPDADELTRIFAVEDGTDYLYMHILHKIHARRQMPVFGNPQL